MYGNIFNIQRFCTDDGDGIRMLFFFKGCPLRCRWCHNPESQSFQSQISYNAGKCINCGMCKQVCPRGCHRMEGVHTFMRKECIVCAKCTEVCPAAALELTGRRYSVEELVEIALKDFDFYSGGGGITLTGGEPLAQGEFAIELARSLKEKGISVNVETCGFCSSDIMDGIAQYCDAFLYDYKVPFELYEKYTGVSGGLIYENLKRISKRNRVILRCPIIGGVNADAAHFNTIAHIAEENSIHEIHLLAYHNLGISKLRFWDMSPREEFSAPSASKLQRAAECIKARCAAKVTIL